MQLQGYTVRDVTPWEGASGGKGIACAAAPCSASMKFDGAAGWYTVNVEYFDQMNGISRFRVRVGEQVIDEWTAANTVPSRRMDSGSSTRRVIAGVALRPGDEIRVEGVPDGGEAAGLDYIEIQP